MSAVRTTTSCLPIQRFGFCSWLRDWVGWDQICLKKYSLGIPNHHLTQLNLYYAAYSYHFLTFYTIFSYHTIPFFPTICIYIHIFASQLIVFDNLTISEEQSEFSECKTHSFKPEVYSMQYFFLTFTDLQMSNSQNQQSQCSLFIWTNLHQNLNILLSEDQTLPMLTFL